MLEGSLQNISYLEENIIVPLYPKYCVFLHLRKDLLGQGGVQEGIEDGEGHRIVCGHRPTEYTPTLKTLLSQQKQ